MAMGGVGCLRPRNEDIALGARRYRRKATAAGLTELTAAEVERVSGAMLWW